MNKQQFLLLIAFLVVTLTGFGQSLSITGNVKDESSGEPIIGASVIIVGTTTGTVTNFDGDFTLDVEKGQSIEISMLGYDKQTFVIDAQTSLDVFLTYNATDIEEVVVIGYGVQKKSDVTGAISSVSGEDLEGTPVATAAQALQGKAAGVQVIQNSGAPGGSTTIKVRGTGTINNSDPLYVVDGFIVDNIDHITPNEIESIEILKDAGSAAIYGARGANGVVIISTKKGAEGKTKINIDYNRTYSTPWNVIDVMGPEDYSLAYAYSYGIMEDGYSKPDISQSKTPWNNYSVNGKLFHIPDPDNYNGSSTIYSADLDSAFYSQTSTQGKISDWWNEITRLGKKDDFNISASGGNNKHAYFISGNFLNEQGFVNKAGSQQFGIKMNLNSKLAPWLKINTNMRYNNKSRTFVPEGNNSILKYALLFPIAPHDNARLLNENKDNWSNNHPVARLDRFNKKNMIHRYDINTELTAEITNGLNYSLRASGYRIFNDLSRFIENDNLPVEWNDNALNTVRRTTKATQKWELNNILSFSKEISSHSISATAVNVIEGYAWEQIIADKKGTPDNSEEFAYFSAAYTGEKITQDIRNWNALGFAGRLNYAFRNKHLIQMNFRADGSSKFAKGSQWGYFPSASYGWKFSDENFMSSFNWLSLGKLRLGWGQSGNDRIKQTERFGIINSGFNYPYNLEPHYLYGGATSNTFGNPNITWEKTSTINIGIDLNLLQNRLSTTFEVFDKRTTDMLLKVPVVLSAGLPPVSSAEPNINKNPMYNAGTVRNYGFETTLNFKNSIGELKYEIGFNLTYIKNVVTSLGEADEPVFGAYLSEPSIQAFITKTEVGKPIGAFYGYVVDGIFQTYDEINASPLQAAERSDIRPGDFKFKDINGDGLITEADRTYIGSPHPDFTYGIPIKVSYKSFDFSMFWQGQHGNEIFNVMDYYLNQTDGQHSNLYTDLRSKHWAPGEEIALQNTTTAHQWFFPANHSGNVANLRANDNSRNFRSSDFMVQDGSYIRLKNVRLSFNAPKAFCERVHLDKLTIYVGAYNLLTFTKYNGLDPEIGKDPDNEDNNTYLGVDHGYYPQTRNIILGINIGI